ncbi:sugar ABC transporter permease [Paenibacillus sp. WQ 127069]|uniref:Sugar ABC transporter permease n=1 Tax=Paenibacillus baimaensis TaxID=2982185 RepID=A0ABT2UFY5_9BACL|nr:sugar ABC transporter permease [Paenibacillus sp. WQ 127069]MCU6793056.1 sugar ABC transporter permease [Paenibacillus sp. WQ 127069]
MSSRVFKLKAGPMFRYLVPIFLIYIFTIILPLMLSIYFSLLNESGTKFAGLDNYLALVKDRDFWYSFKNNLIIVLFCVLGQVGIAFILASLFMSKILKFSRLHRSSIFLPVVLAPVVAGYLWSLIYNYRLGLLNRFLNLMDIPSILWLDEPKYVIYAVSIPLIWKYIGLYLIIFLAGMQNISKDVLEAADIDGASWLQKTVYVIFPLLKNVIRVALILCISGTMKVFDHIYVMTGGGPGTSSMVMAQYAFNNAFTMGKLSYGSTISIGMMILSAVTIFAISKLINAGGNK